MWFLYKLHILYYYMFVFINLIENLKFITYNLICLIVFWIERINITEDVQVT